VKFSRRSILSAGAATAVTGVLAGCRSDSSGDARPPSSEPPDPPDARCAVQFFTPAEAATVEAITARLIPGDADDPGAREAGVVHYIDCLMAVGGFAEPIYTLPPFIAPDDVDDDDIQLPSGLNWSDVAPLVRDGDPGNEPPPGITEILDPDTIESLRDDTVDSTTYGVLPLPLRTFDRYGWQSFAMPPELYRNALRALDDHCRSDFGGRFVDLDDDQQDEVLGSLEDGSAPGFDLPTADGFFEMIRRHTIEGMFADPIYGGNRDYAGWKLIGYPGAYRAWTAVELRTEGTRRPPQGLEHLPRSHPGESDGPPRVVAGVDEMVEHRP